MENRNIPIANCIFAPTLLTAGFFIAFLVWRPALGSGELIYAWAAAGSLGAAGLGLFVGWSFRRSTRFNYALRWLMTLLMIGLIVLALWMTMRDLRYLL